MTFSIVYLSFYKRGADHTYNPFFCECCYGTAGGKKYSELSTTRTQNAPYKISLKMYDEYSDSLHLIDLFLCSEHYDKTIFIFFSELNIQYKFTTNNDEYCDITLEQNPDLNDWLLSLPDTIDAFNTDYNIDSLSDQFLTRDIYIRSRLHDFINDLYIDSLTASSMDMLD